jgi:CBS domain-containing protein
MNLQSVMTRDVKVVRPDATVQEVAEQMRELDVGAVPVCDGEELVGMITDRDIAVRSASYGHDPKSTRVREVMTGEVAWCYEDDSVEEAAHAMRAKQIRRIPVVDHNKKLVGIVSLGDLATEGDNAQLSAKTLETVSEPSRS